MSHLCTHAKAIWDKATSETGNGVNNVINAQLHGIVLQVHSVRSKAQLRRRKDQPASSCFRSLKVVGRSVKNHFFVFKYPFRGNKRNKQSRKDTESRTITT